MEIPYLARGGDATASLHDDRLLELMIHGPGGTAPVKIGIDAPLGWPLAFIAAVADLDAWPGAQEVEPVALVRRRTDRWIHRETGKVPLSVSTDRIAYPAMRAARLIRAYQDATGVRVDRSGMSGPVAEVYPDTAVTRYGLRPAGRRRSYKGRGGGEARAGLLERLDQLAPWLCLCTDQRRACIDSDDAFDALIAALSTRSVQLGRTEPPPPELAAEAAVEGWIHLPRPGALAALAPPRWAGR